MHMARIVHRVSVVRQFRDRKLMTLLAAGLAERQRTPVIVALVKRVAATPPMSSLPAITRPRRSGTLNVMLPSPTP
jgi:hypothetical protein